MTFPRERFDIRRRSHDRRVKLPGKGRIVVWTVVNIEEWEITRPMARQLSQPPMGQTPIPDMPNWTWYEYGMRVGFWRLMRALDKAGVTPTMSINAKVCETYPEVAAAARDAKWEFMAHSYVHADPADRGPARGDCCGADVVRNALHLAVVGSLRIPPGAEHGVASHGELLMRVLRERGAVSFFTSFL